MKLRKPWMIKAAAQLGVVLSRMWLCTMRCRTLSPEQTAFWLPDVKERYLYTIWHENLGSVAAVRSVAPIKALISQSLDGDFVAEYCDRFGIGSIRGSSTRGGVEAVEAVLREKGESHLLVAADGPKGPRREFKRGLVSLSSWSGLPIVPLGVGFQRAWRFNSWDKLVLPKPFSTIFYVTGPVIRVPAKLSKRGSEQYRTWIEQTLNAANDLADALAAGQDLAPQWPAYTEAA